MLPLYDQIIGNSVTTVTSEQFGNLVTMLDSDIQQLSVTITITRLLFLTVYMPIHTALAIQTHPYVLPNHQCTT